MAEQNKGPIFDVTVGEGKYRFMQDAGYKMYVWRNGQSWGAYTISGPDNLHVALATELFELQQAQASNSKRDVRAAALLQELRLLIDALPTSSGEAFDAQLLVKTDILDRLHALVAPLKDLVHEGCAGEYGSLLVVGTDASGKEVLRGSRTSLDPQRDHRLMSSFLLMNDAHELRGVKIDNHQLGSLLVSSAPATSANKD